MFLFPKLILFIIIFVTVVANNVRVLADPGGAFMNNEFKCIRLNEPPYFYCNLPTSNTANNNDKQIDHHEITVRLTPSNQEIAGAPEFFQTTEAPFLVTPTFTIGGGSYAEFAPSPPTTPTQTTSRSQSIFQNNNFSPKFNKNNIFSTITTTATTATTENPLETFFTTLSSTTIVASGLTLEDESARSITTKATKEVVAPKINKNDDTSIIEELFEPPPSDHGRPTIMEELFIDTLTGTTSKPPSPGTLHNEILFNSNRKLFSLCRRYLPFARQHCHREMTHPNYIEPCRGYFQDCDRYILRADPVQEASRPFQMNVRYGNPGFPFQNIPKQYY